MTYGFFLKVLLPPGRRIKGDESDSRELALPDPIGVISYRGSPRGTSFSEASSLLFMGSGYKSYEKAEKAGQRLKAVIQLASLDIGIAIDVGKDGVLGGPGQVVIEAAAQDGVLLLPDVHGLKVFEETGQPMQLTGTANASVLSPLAGFESALKIRSTRTGEFDAKHALAAQLHSLSDFETSQRSRLLTLVTALDVLSIKRARGGISEEVAGELLTLTRGRLQQARKSGRYDEDKLKSLESLQSVVGGLKYQSIAASIKELGKGVNPSILTTDLSIDEIVDLAYKARNELIHGGETEVDLVTLLGPLSTLTAELSGGDALSVRECAAILGCSESTVRRNITNGRLRAYRQGHRWSVRPVDLKLFMIGY